MIKISHFFTTFDFYSFTKYHVNIECQFNTVNIQQN